MTAPPLPRALAGDTTTRVSIDDAGIIHIDVGPLSLRLEYSVCADLTTILAKAMVRLARERLARAQPPHPRLTLLDT